MGQSSFLQQMDAVASKIRSLERDKREAVARMQALERERNEAVTKMQVLERENGELIGLISQAAAKVDEILKIGVTD